MENRSPSQHPAADSPDHPEIACQIEGCERPGRLPQKIRGKDDLTPVNPDEADPFQRHYICEHHHRIYLGVKVVLFSILIVFALVAFFNL